MPRPGGYDIVGRFRVKRFFAWSTGGTSYLADEPKSRRTALARVFDDPPFDDEDDVRPFRAADLSAIEGLRHPNVAEVLESGTVDETPFIVREFVEGQSMVGFFGRGPLDERTAVSYLVQALAGLDAMARRGFGHGRLRPSQFFVTETGVLKLTDFGVAATLADGGDGAASSLLTHFSNDVATLGAMFFHLLAGTPMPAGDRPRLISLRPRLTPRLCAVIERMLVDDRQDGFPNYDEILGRLMTVRAKLDLPEPQRFSSEDQTTDHEFDDDEPDGCSEGPDEPVVEDPYARWSSRRPSARSGPAAAVAGVAVLLSAILAVCGLIATDRPRRRSVGPQYVPSSRSTSPPPRVDTSSRVRATPAKQPPSRSELLRTIDCGRDGYKNESFFVALAGRARDVLVGPGGRTLVVHIAERPLVQLFDVATARITKTITLDVADRMVAVAGKQLVAVGPQGDYEWVDLDTGTVEMRGKLSGTDRVCGICAGSDSNGPMLVCRYVGRRAKTPYDFAFYDLRGFERLPHAVPFETLGYRDDSDGCPLLDASPNGQLFVIGSDVHRAFVAFHPGKAHYVREGLPSLRSLRLTASGRHVMTDGGVYAIRASDGDGTAPDPKVLYVPSMGGELYLRVYCYGVSTPRAFLCRMADHRALADLNGLTDMSAASSTSRIPASKRIWFMDDCLRLVTLPPADDRLEIRNVDTKKAIANGVVPITIFVSEPPLTAKRGEEYVYRMQCFSLYPKGLPFYTVNLGPKGATMEDGCITWKVPEDFPLDEMIFAVAMQLGDEVCAQGWTVAIE